MIDRHEKARHCRAFFILVVCSGVAVMAGKYGVTGIGCARCLPALPEFFVEMKGHGIAQRLDQCQCTAHTPVATDRPADHEGHAEVQAGKAQGLAHIGQTRGRADHCAPPSLLASN